ncbi:MAG: hypothetical protein U0229_02525 [Anaeromyxobacter sp.]
MPRAFNGSIEYRVRADRDLGESWAVSVLPPEGADPGLPPHVVKLQGNDRDAVIRGALEILRKAGRIERWEP